MDRKAAGLAGVLAVSSLAAAHAAVPAQPTSRANAYAELLKPIPNAAEALKAADAAAREQASQQKAPVKVQLAQYWGNGGGYYHHHHHHHHDYYQQPQWYPRYYHHHHHHHHHHHWQGGGWGGQ
ncbi:hypothetical protein [Rhodoblastus sp.]|jgi:hypothetical protein|uniref:hypothetical protein n=1 Tax=Rhodoblastus sp. TaxID=1962975 RepID=UPI002615DE6D|nr:hypothetical protein [Rhodoblastus sp.]